MIMLPRTNHFECLQGAGADCCLTIEPWSDARLDWAVLEDDSGYFERETQEFHSDVVSTQTSLQLYGDSLITHTKPRRSVTLSSRFYCSKFLFVPIFDIAGGCKIGRAHV